MLLSHQSGDGPVNFGILSRRWWDVNCRSAFFMHNETSFDIGGIRGINLEKIDWNIWFVFIVIWLNSIIMLFEYIWIVRHLFTLFPNGFSFINEWKVNFDKIPKSTFSPFGENHPYWYIFWINMGGFHQMVKMLTSVSYTHLTLPTIYSV